MRLEEETTSRRRPKPLLPRSLAQSASVCLQREPPCVQMYEEVYLNSASFGKPGPGPDDDDQHQQHDDAKDKEPLADSDTVVHVSHNSILNCLFILTKSNRLVLYDCNSRVVLRTIDWSREAQHLQDKYLNPGRLKDTSKDHCGASSGRSRLELGSHLRRFCCFRIRLCAVL